MSNQSPVEVLGIVEEVSGGGRFKVSVTLGGKEQIVDCYASGKIRMNKISVIKGDKVRVVLPPPYNLGRIVFREK